MSNPKSIRAATAIASVFGALAVTGPADGADGYDDASVTKISIEQIGPGGTGKQQATCKYGYQNTGTTTSKVPWTAVQFYLRKSVGATIEPYHAQKSCVGPSCTAHAIVPVIAPPGGILGCRIVKLQDNAALQDAIATNDFKEIFVSAEAAPSRGGSSRAGSSTAATTSAAGVGLSFSGNVKQCQTSLAAAVTPSPNQFAGALNGPADFAPGMIMLHLKSSQTAGNGFVCRYASQGKDVPDFAVSIQCQNAAPRAGAAHTYGCTL
jgi:hypothetical protein